MSTLDLHCVLLGGPDRVIVVNGEEIRFEDNSRLGPCPINKRGEERHLGPRHKFWKAVTWWYADGKKLDADGRCVWSEPPDPREGMVHLGGSHWATPAVAARLRAKLERGDA